MKPNSVYSWEIQTINGNIFNQYNEDGSENSWKEINIDDIIRVSFVSKLILFPQHDIIIDINDGEKFVKRFGRGFIVQKPEGFKLNEYINCVETNKYRVWIFASSGRVMITKPDYEVYI